MYVLLRQLKWKKQNNMQMKKYAQDLFNEVLKKHRFPYVDEELEELLDLINLEEHKTFYLGSGFIENQRQHYLLVLWDEEAVVGVKLYEPKGINYTFFHLKMEREQIKEIAGLYSTLIPKKAEEFDYRMGRVQIHSQDDKIYFLLAGVLDDVRLAKTENVS